LVKFDLATRQLRTHSLAIGHQTPEYPEIIKMAYTTFIIYRYTLHSYVNDGREFGASIYHQVSKNVELGTQLSWQAASAFINARMLKYVLVGYWVIHTSTSELHQSTS
jgi:hypothetical protein